MKFASLINKPRTRPKLILGKKSRRSMLKTYLLLWCFFAFVMMDLLRLNPCAMSSFRLWVSFISATQFWSKSDKRRCSNLRSGDGALIFRTPPLRLDISNELYLLGAGFL